MQELEFYGGPFDGHSEYVDTGRPVDRLAGLVCEAAFRMLDGKPNRNLGSVTSVAIYELEVGDGQFRYDHSCSVSFNELMTSLKHAAFKQEKAQFMTNKVMGAHLPREIVPRKPGLTGQAVTIQIWETQ